MIHVAGARDMTTAEFTTIIEFRELAYSLWVVIFQESVDITISKSALRASIPIRKIGHGGPLLNYTKRSAVAIEQEAVINALHTPQWGVSEF